MDGTVDDTNGKDIIINDIIIKDVIKEDKRRKEDEKDLIVKDVIKERRKEDEKDLIIKDVIKDDKRRKEDEKDIIVKDVIKEDKRRKEDEKDTIKDEKRRRDSRTEKHRRDSKNDKNRKDEDDKIDKNGKEEKRRSSKIEKYPKNEKIKDMKEDEKLEDKLEEMKEDIKDYKRRKESQNERHHREIKEEIKEVMHEAEKEIVHNILVKVYLAYPGHSEKEKTFVFGMGDSPDRRMALVKSTFKLPPQADVFLVESKKKEDEISVGWMALTDRGHYIVKTDTCPPVTMVDEVYTLFLEEPEEKNGKFRNSMTRDGLDSDAQILGNRIVSSLHDEKNLQLIQDLQANGFHYALAPLQLMLTCNISTIPGCQAETNLLAVQITAFFGVSSTHGGSPIKHNQPVWILTCFDVDISGSVNSSSGDSPLKLIPFDHSPQNEIESIITSSTRGWNFEVGGGIASSPIGDVPGVNLGWGYQGGGSIENFPCPYYQTSFGIFPDRNISSTSRWEVELTKFVDGKRFTYEELVITDIDKVPSEARGIKKKEFSQAWLLPSEFNTGKHTVTFKINSHVSTRLHNRYSPAIVLSRHLPVSVVIHDLVVKSISKNDNSKSFFYPEHIPRHHIVPPFKIDQKWFEEHQIKTKKKKEAQLKKIKPENEGEKNSDDGEDGQARKDKY